jgi:hypothetical protein
MFTLQRRCQADILIIILEQKDSAELFATSNRITMKNNLNLIDALKAKLIDENDKETTIGAYLCSLLQTLWKQEEKFNGKQPFGNSGWKHYVYQALVRNGHIKGQVHDDDGQEFIDKYDIKKADKFIMNLIKEVFSKP